MVASLYVNVYGHLWSEISSFQSAMLTLLYTTVGSVSNKMHFLGLVQDIQDAHGSWLELGLAWFMATIVNEIVMGVIFGAYFFSIVLYPYARYKARAAGTPTVKEDITDRMRWTVQVCGVSHHHLSVRGGWGDAWLGVPMCAHVCLHAHPSLCVAAGPPACLPVCLSVCSPGSTRRPGTGASRLCWSWC